MYSVWLPTIAAGFLLGLAEGWSSAKMWIVMYRGGLLAGAMGLAFFVAWRVVASRREHARLEELVASRTRQLRQSEELFRSIFEHATEGIFQSSLDGHNLRANPAMARLCGYASPQEMRRELTDVATLFYVQPGRRAEINEKVLRQGTVQDCESEIQRKGGGTIWIAESVSTVVDPATGETVYQGSIVDITARREMQAAQEAARTAAEAANRAKSAFLAHITHELRTPLTGILGNARVALLDPSTDRKNRERFAQVAGGGEHLLRLIDEVLDLSRIEAGGVKLRVDPFDLAELLRGVSAHFHLLAAETRLVFRCEAEPALPRFARGDASRLRQVLDNLLCNALKFTDQGEIVLAVQRHLAGVPSDDPPRVRFEVRDTGIGIAAEHQRMIFQPFQQAVTPGRPATPGVGLGLSISARLVELLGGNLRVESTPTQGSRFFFDLPLPNDDIGKTLREPGSGGTETPPTVSPPRAPPLIAPPEKEIDALLALSLAGDIVRLRQFAAELTEANPDCADFVRELERLAAGFRMDAISQYLRAAKDASRRDPAASDTGNDSR